MSSTKFYPRPGGGSLKLELERPICDVCNRPVERMDSVFSAATQQLDITVRCHGQFETVRVDGATMHLLDHAHRIEAGRAFLKTVAALPEGKARSGH